MSNIFQKDFVIMILLKIFGPYHLPLYKTYIEKNQLDCRHYYLVMGLVFKFWVFKVALSNGLNAS